MAAEGVHGVSRLQANEHALSRVIEGLAMSPFGDFLVAAAPHV